MKAKTLGRPRYGTPRHALLACFAVTVLLLALSGCGYGAGAQREGAPSTAGSETTLLPRPSIPIELERFAPLVDRLITEGVFVVAVEPLAPDAGYGEGLTVVIRSRSQGDKLLPEDARAQHLVLRAAVVAKTGGMKIDAIGCRIENNRGSLLAWEQPVDRTIDSSWYSPAGISLADATEDWRADLEERLAGTPFRLVDVTASVDVDGTRMLTARLTVPSVEAANAALDRVMRLFSLQSTGTPKADNLGKIGLLYIRVDTVDGEPVVDYYVDLQLRSEGGYINPGITNYWFPSPWVPEPSEVPGG